MDLRVGARRGLVWWNCGMASVSGFVLVSLTDPESRHWPEAVVTSAMQRLLFVKAALAHFLPCAHFGRTLWKWTQELMCT